MSSLVWRPELKLKNTDPDAFSEWTGERTVDRHSFAVGDINVVQSDRMPHGRVSSLPSGQLQVPSITCSWWRTCARASGGGLVLALPVVALTCRYLVAHSCQFVVDRLAAG